MKPWWHPEIYQNTAPFRQTRQTVIRTIRHFFDTAGFTEVDTPTLVPCPGDEIHLQTFQTTGQMGELYLHTSPELAMKKLIVAGEEKIFQLCHTYRNEPSSQTHSPEFTMLEWYRTNADYAQMMTDTTDVVRACTTACGQTGLRFQNRTCNPFLDWQRLSVTEAFKKYAEIDLTAALPQHATLNPDPEPLRILAQKAGITCADFDTWEDIFFRIMLNKIEPFLGDDTPLILYDYPTCLGALARQKPTDERFVERFEVYACGVELCNAFSELTDAKEQTERFSFNHAMRQKLYGNSAPIDTDFLDALHYGLPDCAGNALGVDRLIMLICGTNEINKTKWVPIS